MISVLVVLLCLFSFLLADYLNDETIGTISGAEYEHFTVGDKQYEQCANAPYHSVDKDKRLGKIKSGDLTFYIYSVKGTDQYLYCRWEWEGHMYKLIQD